MLISNFTSAQNVRFRKISGEGEFAYSSITAIKEDYLGRMWFGTREGLYLYDGTNLHPFLHDPNQRNTISSSWIECIEEDKNRNLWIGTTHGINRISLNDFSIQRYFYKENTSDNPVNALLADNENNIWLSCIDGIFRYDTASKAFKKETLNIDLPGRKITGVYKSKNGTILILTDQLGIFKVQGERELVAIPNETLKNYHIVSLDEDEDGNYIIGTRRNGLLVLNKKLSLSKLEGTISKKILSVCVDNDGLIYAGTDGDGICIVNRKEGTTQCLKTEGNSGIQNNVIHRLAIDSRDILWVGGINSGVSILDKYSAAHKHILVDKLDAEKIGNKINVLDLLQLEGFEVLAATDGDGLFRINTKTGRYVRLSIPNAEIVKTLYRDNRGNIWGGTYQKGLLQLSPDLKLMKHFPKLQNPGGTVSDDNVWSILEDNEGNMWFGTLNGGLFLFDTEKETFYSCMQDLPQFLLRESFISSLIIDKENSVWVGTKNGAYKYDDSENRFRRYPQEFIDGATLSNNFVRDIFQDKSGRMWIGTENGLTLVENDTVQYFSQSSGLSGNRIQSIKQDINDNIWIATTYGLNLLQKNNTFRTFLEKDGLSSNIFNSNSGIAFSDGSVAFNTLNGLTCFSLKELYKDEKEPQIVFSDLWINGKAVKQNESRGKHISITDQLTLKYGERSFALGFSALSYLHSEKNLYSYKLVGFDDEWIQAGNEQRATYTNLEPGDYVFRVKAANGDGVWNEEGISLDILVLPPWWNTMLAKFIYLVLLVGVILFFRNYVVQGERFKNEIEKKELEAQRVEEVAHFKNQFFTNISHELRTPLSLIIAPVSSLLTREKDLSSAQRLGYYKTIKKNSERLLNLVNQLLDFRKLETGNWKPKIAKIRLKEFLLELVDKFESSDETGHIQFQLDCKDENIELFADWQMLENIFYNLVSNSIKHAKREEISIHVGCKATDKDILLWVEDNGIGISPEEQERIFDRFYQSKDHGIGSGIGLAFVKELVELHNANISLKSEPEKGARVELLFKKGADHYPKEHLVEDTKMEIITEPEITIEKEQKTSGQKHLPKLVIVEDSTELSSYLKNEFAREFRIKTAANGKEGLKVVEQFNPDIIISDVMMPEMDGIEFCKRIKNKLTFSHIPVILLTAKSNQESQLEGYESGADAYVLKPFNIDILRKQVSSLLEIREQLKNRFALAPMASPKKMDISELDKRLLTKLNKYIDENIQNSELSIEGISKEIGISRSYFHKKLKALTGSSASEYVRNYRLKRAAKLLQENQYSIEEISYEVGFSSPSYFSRSFTKLYGVSPKNYVGGSK